MRTIHIAVPVTARSEDRYISFLPPVSYLQDSSEVVMRALREEENLSFAGCVFGVCEFFSPGFILKSSPLRVHAFSPLAHSLFMYATHFAGLEADESEFLGAKMDTVRIDSLAKEIAKLPHDWDPNDILGDEEMMELVQVLGAMEVRDVRIFRDTSSAALDLVYRQVSEKGKHLLISL